MTRLFRQEDLETCLQCFWVALAANERFYWAAYWYRDSMNSVGKLLFPVNNARYYHSFWETRLCVEQEAGFFFSDACAHSGHNLLLKAHWRDIGVGEKPPTFLCPHCLRNIMQHFIRKWRGCLCVQMIQCERAAARVFRLYHSLMRRTASPLSASSRNYCCPVLVPEFLLCSSGNLIYAQKQRTQYTLAQRHVQEWNALKLTMAVGWPADLYLDKSGCWLKTHQVTDNPSSPQLNNILSPPWCSSASTNYSH